MTERQIDPVHRSARFDCDPLAIRASRALVSEVLSRQGWDPLDVERAQLAVSELVANAVVHAGSPFTLAYRYDGALRVEVTDADPASEPRPQDTDPRRVGGMGLRLVTEMSRAWGFDRTQTHKTVWCELEPQHSRQLASSRGV